MNRDTREEQARQLRYKRPALASMGWWDILEELSDIQGECDEIAYSYNPEDIMEAFDGDTERTTEFQIAFSDLSIKCDQLNAALEEVRMQGEDYTERYFNDCTVALIGNRYRLVGFDTQEEDYYHLSSYEEGLATTEAGKRLMKFTKAEMISNIGQCMGILLAFYDLRQQYDYLAAELEVLRGDNAAILKTIKAIEACYAQLEDDDTGKANKEFDSLLRILPQQVWIQ